MDISRVFRAAGAVGLAIGVGLGGCAPEDGAVGRQSTVLLEEGGGGSDGAPLAAVASEAVAAFDPSGALVVARLGTGERLDRAELGVDGRPADIAWDAPHRRFMVVVEDEEAGTSVVAVPLEGARLGAPQRLFGTLGRTRIAVVPDGIVTATDEDGARVHLARNDGRATPGHALAPIRAWTSGGPLIDGLAMRDGEEPMRIVLGVDADDGGVAIALRAPIGVTAEAATWVRDGDQNEWVVLRGPDGLIEIAELDPAGRVAPQTRRALGTRAGRLDGVVAWPPGHLAIALGKPPALVVASTAAATEETWPLEAPAASGEPYGRRSLVASGDRLLVATKEGVVAFVASPSRDGAVTVDGAFAGADLRGPLAVFVP